MTPASAIVLAARLSFFSFGIIISWAFIASEAFYRQIQKRPARDNEPGATGRTVAVETGCFLRVSDIFHSFPRWESEDYTAATSAAALSLISTIADTVSGRTSTTGDGQVSVFMSDRASSIDNPGRPIDGPTLSAT